MHGVILTGAGDKAFIAGADISELAHVDAYDAEALYSYEGTYQMQNLIVGKAITGHGAFV